MQEKSPIDNQFPPLESALVDPNGLLATGGDLSCERLKQAYSLGIFPWFNDDQPIMWWSPDPRAVMYPHKLRLSRSLKKTMRQNRYQLSVNRDFEQVIRACAETRKHSVAIAADNENNNDDNDALNDDTWITDEMMAAYIALHHQQQAHSFEVWDGNELIGGLYGIATGRVFSGESMFHRRSDASKIAFALSCKQIQQWGFDLLDCQIMNPHLESLGVEELPRADFKKHLPNANDTDNINKTSNTHHWRKTDWANTVELLEAISNIDEGGTP